MSSIHVGPEALHGDYHIACHIVGAPHERAKEARGRRGEEKKHEEEDERTKERRQRCGMEEDEEDEEDVDANRIAIYPRAWRL